VFVIGVFFTLVILVIWVRLIQIQILGHAHYRDVAKNQWTVKKEIPPVRGGVFDREHRPLALSIRSCSVSIQPAEIKDRVGTTRVLSKRLSIPASELRKKIRSKKSFVWAKRKCTLSKSDREALEGLPGVGIHMEADRVYPFGPVASKLVGFVGHDNQGMAGIEAAFDQELKGLPGWEELQRDGRYRSRGFFKFAQKKPVDGNHVILTIDARLQEISEIELERAVRKSEASWGVLVLMDCKTGEILSLAEYPSARSRYPAAHVDSLWTIRSISYAYEPGSTFKLITSAALLETGKVNSYDVFDAENGRANLGAAVISDAHPHGNLTFREGFVLSSNIVMAKASLNLGADDFFRFIRLFGFGSKTGIRLLGESSGSVAPVKTWSKRTKITMAFGQEVAVTPLQLANAFAAVANGGQLMVPRLIRSVVDQNSGVATDFEPIKIRNVIKKDTARRLREYCRAVVEEGTGKRASAAFVAVSGKTGTSQKAGKRNGYMQGKFVSSFVGFAPHDDPRIVCLVMLDEPNFANRFGGVSAAPVFARINRVIANSSHYFDDVLRSDEIEETRERQRSFRTPNFLRMDRDAAMQLARRLGMNVLYKGESGHVVAQDPDPSVLMAEDEIVRLYLSDGRLTSAAGDAPDLCGMPLRLAKRRAAEKGFRCRVVGSGIVASQAPKPGAKSKSGIITLHCRQRVPKA
jgi:stage V sporulation protein D (sporulation-specific penicillin-binding protein)